LQVHDKSIRRLDDTALGRDGELLEVAAEPVMPVPPPILPRAARATVIPS
jgi:hypothetical protein